MTTQTPTLSPDTWLDAVLSEDATLLSLAPGGVFGRGATLQSIRRTQPSWPAVVYGYEPAGSKETYALDGALVFVQARYRIEVIDKSESPVAAAAAMAHLHALIADPRGSDPSGQILRCTRLRLIDRQETADGGAQFQHVGGHYEIWVRGG